MEGLDPPLQKWQLGMVFIPDSIGYLLGTNCFGAWAYRVGRHRVAAAAMVLTGFCAFMVAPFPCSFRCLVFRGFSLADENGFMRTHTTRVAAGWRFHKGLQDDDWSLSVDIRSDKHKNSLFPCRRSIYKLETAIRY